MRDERCGIDTHQFPRLSTFNRSLSTLISLSLIQSKQSRVVETAEAFFLDEPFPLCPAIGEGGRFKSERLGQFADQPDVLELQRCSSAGGEVAPHHAIAVEIEDAAFRKAAEQRLAHQRGIEARELRESQGLGHGVDRLRDDELVCQLGHLAGTGGPEVRDAFAHDLENRQRALE
jgi:hypothetical protein